MTKVSAKFTRMGLHSMLPHGQARNNIGAGPPRRALAIEAMLSLAFGVANAAGLFLLPAVAVVCGTEALLAHKPTMALGEAAQRHRVELYLVACVVLGIAWGCVLKWVITPRSPFVRRLSFAGWMRLGSGRAESGGIRVTSPEARIGRRGGQPSNPTSSGAGRPGG